MNNLTYPVVPEALAYLKTSEEPVFVLSISENIAHVRRPVSTSEGTVHKTETYTLIELETREQKVINEMAFQQFAIQQRDNAAKVRQEAAKSPEPVEYLN